MAEGIIETTHEPLPVLDAEPHIQTVSQALVQQFQLDPARLWGQPLAALSPADWDHTALHNQLKALSDGSGAAFDDLRLPGPGGRPVRAFARHLLSASHPTGHVLLVLF